MNHQSNEELLHAQVVLLRLQEKSTEELAAIWQENDQSEWTKADFDAIQKILLERTGKLPERPTIKKAEISPESGNIRKFRFTRKEYFIRRSLFNLILDFFLAGVVAFANRANGEPADSILAHALLIYVIFVAAESFLLWIESSWVEENSSILVSDSFIVGPSHHANRWKLMKWKRVKIPFDKIDKEKSRIDVSTRTFIKARFPQEPLIVSLDGKKIFIDSAFTENQISQILALLALK